MHLTPRRLQFLPALGLLVVGSQAQAHTGHATSGLAQGLVHPLSGLDHLLAMVAVGLWAYQMRDKLSWWVFPFGFVSSMILGASFGMLGLQMPWVEGTILASVLLLGISLLWGRVPVALSLPMIGLFGLAHGFAHGAEAPVTSSGVAYAFGFFLATASLHALGIFLGFGLVKRVPAGLHYAGALLVCSGAALAWVG